MTVRRLSTTVFLAMLLALADLPAAVATAGERGRFDLAAGPIDSAYYDLGLALSSLVKVKLAPRLGVDLTARSTRGSADNLDQLQTGAAQLGPLLGLHGDAAERAQEAAGRRRIGAIMALWRNAEHLLLRQDYVTSGTFEDFIARPGLRLLVDQSGPDSFESSRQLPARFGIALTERYAIATVSNRSQGARLAAGRIDAVSAPVWAPAAALRPLFAPPGAMRLLAFTDAQIRTANAGRAIWQRHLIAAATYPNQPRAVRTMVQANLLAVRADLASDLVYALTRTVFEALDFLRRAHPALAEVTPEGALRGLTLPLHPGALRYFQEAGLLPPSASPETVLRSVDQGDLPPVPRRGAGPDQAPAAPAIVNLAGHATPAR